MSLIKRISGSFRGRPSGSDSKSARMLGESDEADTHSSVGAEMSEVTPSSRVVDASFVNVTVALSRPEDTEHLRRKENVFFALFRKPLVEVQRVNPRIAKSEWGDINPLFISKLLVNFNFSLP
jgi:hypothetical protein